MPKKSSSASKPSPEKTSGAVLLSDLITDQNQQVHCTIVSVEEVGPDLFDLVVAFSDESEGKGEVRSPAGAVPKEGEEWKLQLEDVICGYRA